MAINAYEIKDANNIPVDEIKGNETNIRITTKKLFVVLALRNLSMYMYKTTTAKYLKVLPSNGATQTLKFSNGMIKPYANHV
jgi:hypothetical protein